MAMFQQILGINTVIYFGATILKFAGYTTSTSVYEAVYLGIINMVGAIVALLLLDKVGRRPLMIIGTSGDVLTLIGLGWFFHMSSAFQHANTSIALGLIMAYLLFFEISLGPIFWVMIAEIYPLRSRAKAMAAATMVNWTFNFLSLPRRLAGLPSGKTRPAIAAPPTTRSTSPACCGNSTRSTTPGASTPTTSGKSTMSSRFRPRLRQAAGAGCTCTPARP